MLLVAGNGLSAPQSIDAANEPLPIAFERAVQRFRFRTALVSSAWRPTYQALNDTANCLAHSFLRHGGAPADRIAILMQHDTPMIAAKLAILKAGRVVVVLNPTHPPGRLKQLIADAEPRYIVTDFVHRDIAANIIGRDCSVVRFEEESAGEAIGNPSINVKADQVAVLSYTSGSTGAPKAVMMTHRQIHRNALVHTEAMDYTLNDRLPLFAALSGNQAVTLTWCALLNGAALYPFPVIVKGITGLAEWMIDNGITVYVSSASIFRSLTRILDKDFKFSGVRAVRLASETVTADDFALFRKHFCEESMFVHTLSSSETGNIAVSRHSWHDPIRKGKFAVGTFSKGVEASLVDDENRPVAPGEIGRIVVKGRYVAAGYWRNPTLSAERFSCDLDGTGIRIVHTGDLGRINADGKLEFCGRKDDRVKIRGNRVEVSEIENALRKLPGVDHAVVEAVTNESRETSLAAYVVADKQTWSSRHLRSALRDVLPGYMVPSTFLLLDSLPFTPTGKVDRHKLRNIQPASPEQTPGKRPRSQTESRLIEIWEKAFELETVSPDDDFFDLGGDSLIAAVIAAQVHAAFDVALNLEKFTEYAKLADLASFIDELRAAEIDNTPLPVRMPRDRPLPMSFAQERVWKISRASGPSSAHNTARIHRICGPLDKDVLRECMSYIAARHEILRATFAAPNGQPVQIAHPSQPVTLPFLDLTAVPDPEAQALIACKREAAWVFDPEHGPLAKFLLIRLRDGEHWLMRTAHHIICDSRSWVVFFRELSVLYEAALRGEKLSLGEPLPLQYGDWAFWERQTFHPKAAASKAAVAWWRATLSSAPRTMRLPFRRLRSRTGLDPALGMIHWGLNPEISRRLDAFGAEHAATPYMIRLAAFVALLAFETRQRDVVLGTYMSSRNRMVLQGIFGPFTNLVTLRFACEAKLNFHDWLERVRRQIGATESYCGIPYDNLCEALRAEGVTIPAISAIFSISHHHDRVQFGGLEITRLSYLTDSMPWGFSMNFDPDDEEHEWRTSFDARKYDPAKVQAFLDRFRGFLETVSLQPDLPISEIAALSGAAPRPSLANKLYRLSFMAVR